MRPNRASTQGAHINRNPPDTIGFAASFAPFTGFGNGKSPLSQAKSDQDLPLKRSTAEARPICLQEGVLLPRFPDATDPGTRHAGAGGARSRAISDRISANICLGTPTSASWNVTYRP